MFKTFSLLFYLILFTLITPVKAGPDAFMEVFGANQGPILGDVAIQDREGTFQISEMHHLFQENNGSVSHKPLIITTHMSKGLPSLLRAMKDNESLSITIRFYVFDIAGKEFNNYTIVLTNARVSAYEPIMYNNEVPENLQRPIEVRIRFTYVGIIHHYVPDNDQVILNAVAN